MEKTTGWNRLQSLSMGIQHHDREQPGWHLCCDSTEPCNCCSVLVLSCWHISGSLFPINIPHSIKYLQISTFGIKILNPPRVELSERTWLESTELWQKQMRRKGCIVKLKNAFDLEAVLYRLLLLTYPSSGIILWNLDKTGKKTTENEKPE